MATPIHLVAMSGSLRKGSFNTMLLHTAMGLLPEGVTMQIVSIAEIPLYNADMDLPLAKERPEVVTNFRNSLSGADGFLIRFTGIQLFYSGRIEKCNRLGFPW
jgi:chromate reductase